MSHRGACAICEYCEMLQFWRFRIFAKIRHGLPNNTQRLTNMLLNSGDVDCRFATLLVWMPRHRTFVRMMCLPYLQLGVKGISVLHKGSGKSV